MNAAKLLSAIAVALAALAGVAHADTYEGVHPLTTGASRAAVANQGVAAAHAGYAYSHADITGISTSVPVFSSTANRSAVRAEAVAESHDPLGSLDRRAFFRDEVPAQYSKSKVSFTQQATR